MTRATEPGEASGAPRGMGFWRGRDMVGPKTAAVVARLQQALGRLEAAVAVQSEIRSEVNALAGDRALLARDRDRLAAELDEAADRAARLGEANERVAARLIAVMEDVRRMAGACAAAGDGRAGDGDP